MKKLLLILTCFCIFSNTLLAQETVYFKSDNASKSKKKTSKGSSEQNIIKIAPFGFVGGNIPFFYERSLNETFSIQVGLGITTKNYLLTALRAASDNNSSSVYGAQSIAWSNGGTNSDHNNQIDDIDNNNFWGRKSKLGLSYSIEPKVYIESEGLEGSFFSISFNGAKYSNSINTVKKGVQNTGTLALDGGTFNEFYKINNFLVNWGSQTLYDHISLEYSLGIGLKKVSSTTYAYSYDNNNKVIDGIGTTKGATTLGYNIAFRVGYHF
jgi:hypothetical protein